MVDDRLEPHPWNQGFTWVDREGPFRRLTSAQVESFDRDGFVVLPDVFGDAELEPLIEVIDRNEAATDQFLQRVDGGRISIAESGAITFTVTPDSATSLANALDIAIRPAFEDP